MTRKDRTLLLRVAMFWSHHRMGPPISRVAYSDNEKKRVKGLMAEGLLSFEREGSAKLLYLTPEGEKVLSGRSYEAPVWTW